MDEASEVDDYLRGLRKTAEWKLAVLATVDRAACEALKEGALRRLPVSAEQVGLIVGLYLGMPHGSAVSPVSVEGLREHLCATCGGKAWVSKSKLSDLPPFRVERCTDCNPDGAIPFGPIRSPVSVEGPKPTVDYDPEADALYVHLRDGERTNTVEVNTDLLLDVDADGVTLGVEVLTTKPNPASPSVEGEPRGYTVPEIDETNLCMKKLPCDCGKVHKGEHAAPPSVEGEDERVARAYEVLRAEGLSFLDPWPKVGEHTRKAMVAALAAAPPSSPTGEPDA